MKIEEIEGYKPIVVTFETVKEIQDIYNALYSCNSMHDVKAIKNLIEGLNELNVKGLS